jgi:GNAT superfamily N-acetyltransferase
MCMARAWREFPHASADSSSRDTAKGTRSGGARPAARHGASFYKRRVWRAARCQHGSSRGGRDLNFRAVDDAPARSEHSPVWVREDLRAHGRGRQLVEAAEAEARARGCRRVWLDSYAFQAPAFYQRLGYEVFGVLDGYPAPHNRVFLTRIL